MKKLITILCVLALIVGAVSLIATAESYVVKIGDQGYTTLEEAVQHADEGIMVLQQNIDTLIEIPAGLVLDVDLNGKTVNGVSVAEGSEVYVMDSATDDFDGTDCGKITGTVTGSVMPMELTSAVRYLQVEESGVLSFHRLEMAIDSVVLSPDSVGISYKTTFLGDEAVKASVSAFGIAVSIEAEPTVEADGTLSDHCQSTAFTDFTAGTAGNAGSSSKVVGIMKQSNGAMANAVNAEMDIYGKPYVKVGQEYLLGELAQCDLKWVAEQAATDAVWAAQTETAQVAMGAMYDKFSYIMKDWSVEKLQNQAETNFQTAEKKVLKILTLGHSLAVDSGHMLALVANTEGIGDYDELVVGTLYYSGCPLPSHVKFMTNNSPEYNLYISSTKTADQIPTIENGVTMAYGLSYDYWDIIIMQGGVFEIAKDATYTNGDIEKIQAYVNEHKRNPEATFAWHMTWASPEDETLQTRYETQTGASAANNPYKTIYNTYADRTEMYNAITKAVGDNIIPNETFEFMIPTGTAMQNALSSYLTEKDIHRDYIHATELTRLMCSYVWYCRLFGIDQLDAIEVDEIPTQFFHKTNPQRVDPVLTDAEKAIILESVNNALKNPLQMTQSQYTEAPTE